MAFTPVSPVTSYLYKGNVSSLPASIPSGYPAGTVLQIGGTLGLIFQGEGAELGVCLGYNTSVLSVPIANTLHVSASYSGPANDTSQTSTLVKVDGNGNIPVYVKNAYDSKIDGFLTLWVTGVLS